MAREEQAIFTNLCMISDGSGNILVEDRKDPSFPGICFPGGHVELGEAFTDAVVREVLEETGLKIEDPTLCGIKQFPTKNGARYVVLFYRASKFSGEVKASHEGEVFWIPRESIGQYRCCPDFESMLHVMETEELNEFVYFETGNGWELKLL